MSTRESDQQLAAILQSAVDLYGVNSEAASLQTRSVDTTPPAPLRPYEPVAHDGVIAAWEASKSVHLRGRAELEPGATVTLSFNGDSWHSTVNKWGYWNAFMPPAALQGLDDGKYSLTLTITDKAGNSTDKQVNFTLAVDKTLKPTLTLDPVSEDYAVNIAEGVYDLVIRGTATRMAAGSHVQLTLDGKTYQGDVGANGHWRATISAHDLQEMHDGVYALQVKATDVNGKSNTLQHDLTLITHASSLPEISFDSVTADNVINKVESQSDLTISGTLSSMAPGQEVSLRSGGVLHHAELSSDGHWHFTIPAAEVAAFIAPGEVRIYANDAAHNSTDNLLQFNVVTQIPDAYYDINIGGDLTLSYQETQHDLSFHVENIAQLTINGKSYTPVDGVITIGSADLLALPQGDVTGIVEQADQYGNHATQTFYSMFTVATADHAASRALDGQYSASDSSYTLADHLQQQPSAHVLV